MLDPSGPTPIARHLEQWAEVEYWMRVTSRSTQVRLKQAFAISNPQVRATFERRTQGLVTLRTFIPTATLPDPNSARAVCDRGLRLEGSAGMLVSVGNISLPGLVATSREGRVVRRPTSRREIEVLLCEVGIGRAQVVDRNSSPETTELHPEFDSLLLEADPQLGGELALGMLGEGFLPAATWSATYLIRDGSLILPLVLATFELDPALPEVLTATPCAVCQSRPATSFCAADEAALCHSCDGDLHSRNHVVARHTRVPLYGAPGAQLGVCAEHPGTAARLWCTSCCKAACERCQQVHSSHDVAGLTEKYRTVAGQKPLAEVERARARLSKRLVELDGAIAAVQENGQQAEARVYSILESAVQRGVALAEGRIQQYLADQQELKRQLEEGDWMADVLNEFKQELSPHEFLEAWTRSNKIRAEVAKMSELPPHQPPPELAVVGDLTVVAGEAFTQ